MESAWSIKQEIKEEIPDENEQYGNNIPITQNVKNESEFEDELGNYEYAVTDVQLEHLDFETDLQTQPNMRPNLYSSQHEYDFDEDEDDDEDILTEIHTENENEVYVDDEPEIFVEDLGENASDPLAINTKAVYSNDNLPKAILNSTHTPLAPTSMKMLVRRLPPSTSASPSPSSSVAAASLEKRRQIERLQQLPSVYAQRKTPPISELFKKTYSLEHRSAHKTTGWKCHVCARTFSYLTEFEVHRRRCFFNCKKCNLIFKTMLDLQAHHRKCRILSNYRRQKINNSKNSDKSTLVVVERKSQSKNSCDICCTTFNSKQELELHRNQNHLVKNAYACHKCERRFDDSNDAVRHLKQDH